MKKLFILILCFVLTSCYDKHEIEEQAFVVVIGLDDSEKTDGITVTFQVANPQAGIPNTGGEKEEASEIITFTAPDIITARDLANASVARKINFSHTKVMIIGEEFAKTDKAVKFITSSIRDREIRRDIKLIVSKEKAYDFIKNNDPKLETRPHKFYDLMAGRWEETGLVPLSDLQRFLQRIESKQDAYLAIYASTEKDEETKEGNEDDYLPGQINQIGGNSTQLIGSALFKDGVMVGTLSGEETRLSLNLRSKSVAKYMRVSYTDPKNPDYRIGARITKHRNTQISMNFDDELKINVLIPLDLEIVSIPSGVNYVTNKDNRELLRTSIEEDLTKKFEALIQKTQDKYKTNPFNWSNTVRRHFLTLQEFEAYGFKEKYPNAKVSVKVEVKFKDFGKQLTPAQ
ncbi:Ger(x)C family spore germination protein [Bacillus salinus]|uniref:Ger(x)C family spore germination protein n=1 Tax=Bacillus sp. HMF5848 TaxID=2495421 RepID=UPI00163A7BE7|nr:Ger(x)C family spore germination protein [Bacillus sp. HMF5848]